LAGLPFSILYEHVYGHQDKTSHGFHWLCFSNSIALQMANEAMWRAFSCWRYIFSNFPFESFHIIIKGNKVPSSIFETHCTRAGATERLNISSTNVKLSPLKTLISSVGTRCQRQCWYTLACFESSSPKWYHIFVAPTYNWPVTAKLNQMSALPAERQKRAFDNSGQSRSFWPNWSVPPTAYIVVFKIKGLYKIRKKVDSNDWIPFW
jgi:hypothetical protein